MTMLWIRMWDNRISSVLTPIAYLHYSYCYDKTKRRWRGCKIVILETKLPWTTLRIQTPSSLSVIIKEVETVVLKKNINLQRYKWFNNSNWFYLYTMLDFYLHHYVWGQYKICIILLCCTINRIFKLKTVEILPLILVLYNKEKRNRKLQNIKNTKKEREREKNLIITKYYIKYTNSNERIG